MKKILTLFIILCLSLPLFAVAEDTINVIALKGPTGMGLVKMMKDESESARYAFELAGSADEIVPKIAKGDVDIAAVPANLAAILYNNTQGGVRVIAVNTLGVLYIVERGDTVHSVKDLIGRTIYSAGRGASPEYALDYILRMNGIDPEKDVTVEYRSEHAECLAALMKDLGAVALLPQPFVTVAAGKADNLRVALDLTEEWENVQGESGSALITGVMVARTAFMEAHPDEIAAFLAQYAASVAYVNESIEDAAALIEEYGIVAKDIALHAIPDCHIVCVTGQEMRDMLSGYLGVLAARNPASVGGSVPDEDFYYIP